MYMWRIQVEITKGLTPLTKVLTGQVIPLGFE